VGSPDFAAAPSPDFIANSLRAVALMDGHGIAMDSQRIGNADGIARNKKPKQNLARDIGILL
jgi:hypothetical protein